MLNKEAKLSENIFKKDIEKISTRQGWGRGLLAVGRENENIVVLSSDVTGSTKANLFAEEFPDRFIQIGVAEQNLAAVASGIANYGKIPFISAYAIFSPGRNWEQIRTTIAINNLPVKIGGSHAGLSDGGDGVTHQALEDVALMRVLPNMVVIVPSDAIETEKAVLSAATNGKPTYIRFEREETAVYTTSDSPFEIGKAEILWEDKDPKVAIIACGPLVYQALRAARKLHLNKINSIVVNSHTVKPLDVQTIIHVAKLTEAVVTVENHQVSGGLGGAVAEVLAQNLPVPIEYVGMKDDFGESGTPHELYQKYKMTKDDIVTAVKKVIRRKNIN
jgi:transketolase